MSRIVSAVNAMISNPGKITFVQPSVENKDLLYFVYDGKYTWSLWGSSRDDTHVLCYYPDNPSPTELAAQVWEEIKHIPIVRYSTDELKTTEARESFADLYQLLKEKVYKVDAVLDDILAEADMDYDPFAEE